MSYQFATEAILALNPDLQFEIIDDDIDNITWFTDDSITRPTKDEIVAKELEIRNLNILTWETNWTISINKDYSPQR